MIKTLLSRGKLVGLAVLAVVAINVPAIAQVEPDGNEVYVHGRRLDLKPLDFSVAWSVNTPSKVLPCTLAGPGYAAASLDDAMPHSSDARSIGIEDDNGFTLSSCTGLSYLIKGRTLIRLEAHHRYLDAVLGWYGDSLNPLGTTLGIGWMF